MTGVLGGAPSVHVAGNNNASAILGHFAQERRRESHARSKGDGNACCKIVRDRSGTVDKRLHQELRS